MTVAQASFFKLSWQKLKAWFSVWKQDPTIPKTVEGLLRLGIAFLFVAVIATFLYPFYYVVDRGDYDLLNISRVIINSVLLIFIVLELVEIAREQINAQGSDGEDLPFNPRFGKDLIRMLLIVGVLSSVRHLVSIGLELASPGSTGSSIKLWELGMTAGVVLTLVGGLILLDHFYEDPRDGPSARAPGSRAGRNVRKSRA
jgi:hypothetical protein